MGDAGQSARLRGPQEETTVMHLWLRAEPRPEIGGSEHAGKPTVRAQSRQREKKFGRTLDR